jgi:sugar phosphate isomerase/epimerase
MFFTGIADEASKTMAGQIKATHALGWSHIEARSIDSTNLTDIPEEQFDRVVEMFDKAEISINCYGSTIANWSKSLNDDFQETIIEIKRAIPRMKRTNTKFIRIMSYALLPDKEPHEQMAHERFKRLREMQRMFDDAGITAVHENCMNYGGLSYHHTLELLENVPGLKLVFDTGNPIFTDDRSKPKPYPKQSSWEFYTHVKDHISHIHIKDGIWDSKSKDNVYTFPGQGSGDVERILTDLLKNGYDAGISIEPHMTVVFHDDTVAASEQTMMDNYIEYGQRIEKMVNSIKNSID